MAGYGEETGQRAIEAESLWLVDPIDGTKSFVRATPFFNADVLGAGDGAGALTRPFTVSSRGRKKAGAHSSTTVASGLAVQGI
jgi:hypothetical protein